VCIPGTSTSSKLKLQGPHFRGRNRNRCNTLWKRKPSPSTKSRDNAIVEESSASSTPPPAKDAILKGGEEKDMFDHSRVDFPPSLYAPYVNSSAFWRPCPSSVHPGSISSPRPASALFASEQHARCYFLGQPQAATILYKSATAITIRRSLFQDAIWINFVSQGFAR
jgi:hypothetical protein